MSAPGTGGASGVRTPVAIIGMSGVMPGKTDLAGFWQALLDGTDLVGEVPENRWRWQDYVGESVAGGNATTSARGGFIPHVEDFDPALFGISPREAESLDPQQRLLLCAAWEAFENAAIAPSRLAGSRCGVFIGASGSDFKGNIEQPDAPRALHQASGTHQTMLANRISFQFDLNGPSETIDTACSSALVAIHRALMALAGGEIDMALAGGIHLMLNPEMSVQYSKAGMLSPDGRCHTFDHRANGYVRSEGLGCVVLKPLALALAAGDPIHAVIVGSAENHGGRAVSLTAPNPKAQTALIVDSIRSASVAPQAIGLVEAHGTGTALGDPIEVNALKAAFKALGVDRTEHPWCTLGAVKSCVGHLEAAAGMAGLFKAVFSIRHGLIPGNLNFEKTNPHIDLSGSPFALATGNAPWAPGNPAARFATVSSFGFGGVNAHLVIGPPPAVVPRDEARHARVFVLSAPDAERLALQARCLLEHPALAAERPRPDGAALLGPLLDAAAERLGHPLHAPDAYVPYADLGLQMPDVLALCEALHAPLEETGRIVAGTASLAQLANALAASARTDRAPDASLLIRRLPDAPGQAAAWSLDALAATLCLGRQVFDERAIVIAGSSAELAAGLAALAGIVSEADNCWRNNPRKGRVEADRQFADPARQRCYEDGLRWLNERPPKVDWSTHFEYVPQRLALPGLALRLQSFPLGHVDGHLRVPRAARDWQTVLLGENCSTLHTLGFRRRVQSSDPVWSAGAPGGCLAHGLRLFEALAGGIFRLGGGTGVRIDAMAWSTPGVVPPEHELGIQLAANGDQWIAETTMRAPDGSERLLCQAEVGFAPSGEETAPVPDGSWREFAIAPNTPYWADAIRRALATVASPERDDWALFRLEAARIDGDMENRPDRLFVRLRSATAQATCVDLVTLDAAGRPHARLDGLELRARLVPSAEPQTPTPSTGAAMPVTRFARPAWVAQDPATLLGPADTLLVFDSSAERPLATALARALGGTRVRAVTAASASSPAPRDPDVLRLQVAEDWTRIIEDTLAQRGTDRIAIVLPASVLLPPEGTVENVLQMQAALLALGQCGLSRLGLQAVDLLILHEAPRESDRRIALHALAAWGETLRLEGDPLRLRVVDPGTVHLESAAGIERIRAELGIAHGSLASWTDGRRFVQALEPAAAHASRNRLDEARGGAVLVSGGMGTLPVLVAEHLASRYGMRVHLCGRRPPAAGLAEAWQARGLRIHYHVADVASAAALEALVRDIDASDSGLTGVVHCAGVMRDRLAVRKRETDLREVLLPKMAGACALDTATARMRLRFFALFGSVVGRFGNPGQVDYAYANAWLAGFAAERSRKVGTDERSGHTVCIDWPYWADGGMQLNDSEIDAFVERHGVLPLSRAAGLEVLERAVNGDEAHLVVLHGIEADFSRHLALGGSPEPRAATIKEGGL